jgi:hypothetical protein
MEEIDGAHHFGPACSFLHEVLLFAKSSLVWAD